MVSPRQSFLLALAGSMAVHAAVLNWGGMEFSLRPEPAAATVIKVTLAAVQNEPVVEEKPVTRKLKLRPAPRPEGVVPQAPPRGEPVPEPIATQPFIAHSAVENQAPRVPEPAPEAPIQLATVTKARASEPEPAASEKTPKFRFSRIRSHLRKFTDEAL